MNTKGIIKKVYESPTFNTWFSFTIKSLGYSILLPIILKFFSVDEISLWFLFFVFISFQNFIDFGFYTTFVRIISYANSGSKSLEYNEIKEGLNLNNRNTDLLKRIIGTMNVIYKWLSLVVFVVLLLCSFTISSRISCMSEPSTYWIAWAIIVCVTAFNFYGRIYSNFLLGLNKVSLVRRWEGMFGFFSLLSIIIVALITKSFLFTIATHQFWVIANVLRNKYLASKIENKVYRELNNSKFDRPLLDDIWPVVWKSGVSSIASNGLVSFMGVIYSNIGNSVELAQYLFSIKILDVIRDFSKAPFYSKIPTLTSTVAKNLKHDWLRISSRGILLSNCIFVALCTLFSILGSYIFDLIDSNMEFPDLRLWGLLAICYFIHQNGAFHTHLYMSTNQVNSHISDSVAGVLFVSSSLLLVRAMGAYAFPVGMLIGYLGFYIWWAFFYSHKIIGCSFGRFVSKTTVIPLFVMISVLTVLLF